MGFFISKSSGWHENGASNASSLLYIEARFSEGAKELVVFVLESGGNVSAVGIVEG
jgi:hypothetical protein